MAFLKSLPLTVTHKIESLLNVCLNVLNNVEVEGFIGTSIVLLWDLCKTMEVQINISTSTLSNTFKQTFHNE